MEQDRIKREQEFHNEIFSNGARAVTNKFYSVFYLIENKYIKKLTKDSKHKKYLEYGCGEGSSAYLIAKKQGEVTGIDISDFAINQSLKKAASENLTIDFRHMNAEELAFENNSFDVVCGSGIIHHLDINKSYAEISRVLKADGKAIFMEPMGHNVFINWYRNRTPQLRTDDEHPLLKEDFDLLKEYFNEIDLKFFFLSSLVAIPFRKTFLFKPILHLFNGIDQLLFALLPFIKWQAWFALIEVCKPKK